MIKVLIVEDDPMVAEFNKRYLEQVKGFELAGIARSADQALAFLDENQVDLILLDIYLPGTNGLELLADIREKGKGVDVLLITAASDMPSIQKALRYGAVDYLIKPFEFDRFQTALTVYREEKKFIENQTVLSQAELDKRLLHKEQSTLPSELPKGLNRTTLRAVWEKAQEFKEKAFSTDEIAGRVGISRVSMRKYLGFLHDIGVINQEIIYGAIGRPVYMHQIIEASSKRIKNYV